MPCRPGSKLPLLPHAVHDASADAQLVASWWRRWPDANIAVAVPLGGFVVDVDPRNGGDATWAELRLSHRGGPLPPTMTAETRSGGLHILFQRPHGVQLRGKLGPGLDVLGFGKYFLVAPSFVATDGAGSGHYRWLTPRGTPVAEPPSWLLEAVNAREAPVGQRGANGARQASQRAPGRTLERARRYLAAMPAAISGSGGHNATFQAALALVAGFALSSEDDALELLAEYNERCQPPWSERELKHKVSSAARSRAERGWLLGR